MILSPNCGSGRSEGGGMLNKPSQMRLEINEIPDVVEALISHGSADIIAAAKALRAGDPRVVVTVARGSSDHVCAYFKYACELLLGLPVASVGPSVASIWGARMKLAGAACISVSQSGQSPDIVAMAKAARRDGALTLAITNDTGSALAGQVVHVLDIHAGTERSVAATKTFVTSAVAMLLLVGYWRGDTGLIRAVMDLPEVLRRACDLTWPEVGAAVVAAPSLYTLGRGPSWAIANEAALKFKETCRIHAESYSSAEVLHGPVSIVETGFPVVCFAAHDKAEAAVVAIADQLADKGATVFVTSDLAQKARTIEHLRSGHPLADPIALIVSFYAMVERVARARGIDPDRPRHLRKVTQTL